MAEFGLHKILTRRLILKAAFAGLAAALPAAAAESSVGTVAEVTGEANAEKAGQRRKLAKKSPVLLDDTLTTGAASRLRALLAGKTTLRLGAETKVRIDKFIVNSGGELMLGAGALLLDAPANRFKKGLAVESPYALIAVRGTRFFAGPIDGIFGVFVARGLVDVTAGGTTVQLKAGEGTDIAKPGDPPGPVKKWGPPKIAKAMALVR
ncbi:FecR domain-containing protein [soil metagenome]